jgi:type III secretion system YscQ/HrcQ family protein
MGPEAIALRRFYRRFSGEAATYSRAVKVRAFPFDRLSKLERRQLPLLRRVARARIAIDAALARELLGVEVSIRSALVREATAAELVDPLVAILLEHEGGSRACLELEPRLAAVVVDRILGGDAKTVGPVVDLPNDVELGALLYAAARLAGRGWFVRDVYADAKTIRDALGAHALCQQTLRVELGADAGIARLWLRDDFRAVEPESAPAAWPIEVAVIAARGVIGARELATLTAGDVIVLDDAFVTGLAPLAGALELRAGGLRIRCELRGRDMVAIASSADATPIARGRIEEEDDMPEETKDSALADVPIELTIEVARFSMTLAELVKLRAGEVVASGRALGETAVLRAHDRVIATGELVEVDGEIGLRVISLHQS